MDNGSLQWQNGFMLAAVTTQIHVKLEAGLGGGTYLSAPVFRRGNIRGLDCIDYSIHEILGRLYQ